MFHALAAFAAVATAGHLAWAALQLARGRAGSPRLLAVHPRLVAWCLGAALVVGLVLYPHYRVNVRGYVLDREAPWASNLFDVKEYAGVVALPTVLALLGARRHVVPGGPLVRPFAVASLTAFALLAFSLVAGLIVTSVRGV